jgi:hypothetical protein
MRREADEGGGVIVQWCIKGLALPDDQAADAILSSRQGLVCNWWRTVGQIGPSQRRAQLTPANLNRHINHFTLNDFNLITPFISLSAGTVERDRAAQTNLVRRARRTALWFGTEFGTLPTAYLFTCWVVLAPRRAVEIEGVAEEPRDLNTYRRYSAFQTEGEVTAKIIVPDNQIKSYEKWTWSRQPPRLTRGPGVPNPRFTPPERLSNVRELI